MTDVSDLSSILQNSLLLTGTRSTDLLAEQIRQIQEQSSELPSVLDKNTLLGLVDGKYDITLKEYTTLNTYNLMMDSLYGNKSANKFQSTLSLLTNTEEDDLATAKAFVDKMKENGMSNATAIRTYAALQKYSMMSSFGNYNFVKATV